MVYVDERRASATGGFKIVPNTEKPSLSPILKWAGGKRWLLPHIKQYWIQHYDKRFVEPFVGGGAVAFGLLPKNALINDVNPHLVNFYKQIKKDAFLNITYKNTEKDYYRARARFNKLITDQKSDTAEAASIFYYLNKTGYNGLCRFNSKGLFNVPYGRHKRTAFKDDLSEYLSILRDWNIVQKDFENIPLQNGDFIYADPPYDVDFTNYSKDGFSWDDQVRVAHWLAVHEGPVLLSNQATKRIITLYKKLGFKLTFLNAPRMISCDGNRTPAREVLALKNI